jgi:hydroxymethylpyrimidine pyrophosphatase-like HAD family hydrolase
MKSKTIFCDIDGCLATEERVFERCIAKPIQKNIDIINELYDQGHIIILWSARGWQELKYTTEWLKLYGVKYNSILLGKPIFDIFIDDKTININDINSINDIVK